ncbi:MAG: hypothetical protein QGH42_07940 [Kiritimatiellia bacterium]|jgi:hypothetical protein|nr:hypothetical protein [Kiritimatiellia bacterium]MDP6630305.1 hypothetical protein [Kiritimatiellia bacterium]MDP6810812.1 hypothetical protein [Kiritimatiellia bacterium]MDP7024154.1 hypothetical protein [Kiritimatiellia bacterium]
MNRLWITRLSTLLVLAALAGAAGLTLYTLKQADAYRTTMARRTKDLEGLAAVRADLAVYETATAVFESCQAAPPPLRALISGLLPAGQAPEMRDLTEEGPSGWKRARFELSFDQVPAVDALKLALAAEKPVRDKTGCERPGWRLVKCAIRPAPGRPGIGRVVLVMEALVRE